MEQIWSPQLLCAVFFLGVSCFEVSGDDSPPLPDITDKKFIDDCVRIHNAARSAVTPAASDMLYMTWDDGLAVLARAWARGCTFQHNDAKRVHPVFSSVGPLGENIWAGSPPSVFSVERAINKWVAEVNSYSYESNTCQKVCGHYTQVAWASTYKVGCAIQHCPKGVTHFTTERAAIFVCNYYPAGNYVNRKPYNKIGAACSTCPAGETSECRENLCHNPERDALRSYNWTPDWDPALSTCGRSCLAILVIRPLALLITFIAAYVLQRFYPNMFCYE